MNNFSIGIITVSDTCSDGTAIDTSGPHLEELIRNQFSPTIVKYELIPDDIGKIEQTLTYFSDILNLDIIITTGGTGFGPRDVTPEATKRIIHREAPQLALVMALYSLEKTKFAALSRAICGIRNQCLIINMPGSKKAVGECFDAISGILPHALQHMHNDKAQIRKVHNSLQQQQHQENSCCPDHSNNHQHHNESTKENVITKPPNRQSHKHICPHKTGTGDLNDRNSPYPMVPVDQCVKIIFNSIIKLPQLKLQTSPIDIPPFRASIKDGYALKSTGGIGCKKVIKYISAGDPICDIDLADNECFKINTGAPIPDCVDCVIQVEDTKIISTNNDDTEEMIEIFTEPSVDLDIRPIGCDLKKNEQLFNNHEIFPGTVTFKSMLASVGRVSDTNDPIIGVISTGDELIEPGDILKPGKIYDSNMTMLRELLKQFGFYKVKTAIAQDNYESLKQVMTEMTSECPITICTGGVSMGDKDFVKKVLIDLKFKIHFGRCNMKPGKPMTFAANPKGRAVFGLPGNPVSSFVTFHLFVLPALRYITNYDVAKLLLPVISVELENDTLELDPRPEYARATITLKDGQFYAEITGNQISSRLQSIDGADVLLHLPAATDSKPVLKKGTILKASILKHHFISKYVE